MSIWNYFTRTPPSPSVQKPAVGREKSFRDDIRDKIDNDEEFSLVYMQIDKGDIEYIRRLVGGKRTTVRNIGVIVPAGSEYEVYGRLEQLAHAAFA